MFMYSIVSEHLSRLRFIAVVDPLAQNQQKSLEAIGGNLQKQYERWQPRARYKQTLDPTVDEVKKLCTSLRRNAKVTYSIFISFTILLYIIHKDFP